LLDVQGTRRKKYEPHDKRRGGKGEMSDWRPSDWRKKEDGFSRSIKRMKSTFMRATKKLLEKKNKQQQQCVGGFAPSFGFSLLTGGKI